MADSAGGWEDVYHFSDMQNALIFTRQGKGTINPRGIYFPRVVCGLNIPPFRGIARDTDLLVDRNCHIPTSLILYVT